jgi:hypothetical protein
MKKTAFALLCLFLIIIGKSQETSILGKWKVNCAAERINISQLHVCDLCPTTLLNNNTALVEEFELEFLKDQIKFHHEEVPLELSYKFNAENNSISFKYLGKPYVFKQYILNDPSVQILVAETGEVLYLKKL